MTLLDPLLFLIMFLTDIKSIGKSKFPFFKQILLSQCNIYRYFKNARIPPKTVQ